MKKASKLFLVLSALILSLVIGCGGGDDGGDEIPTGYTQHLDWTIVPGWHNDIDAGRLKVESVIEGGGNGALKVTWAASDDLWIACDLFAVLPAGDDYGEYDGISFKLKTPIQSNQYNFQFIAPYGEPPDNTVSFLADQSGAGHEFVANTDTWVTITRAFSTYSKQSWGGGANYTKTSLKDFLTDTKDVEQRIYLSPQLNTDNSSLIDTDIPIYLDNIGFYKGATTNVTVIWDFED